MIFLARNHHLVRGFSMAMLNNQLLTQKRQTELLDSLGVYHWFLASALTSVMMIWADCRAKNALPFSGRCESCDTKNIIIQSSHERIERLNVVMTSSQLKSDLGQHLRPWAAAVWFLGMPNLVKSKHANHPNHPMKTNHDSEYYFLSFS